MNKLVLLRHGQSVWNKEKRFTGWTDVELTPQGIQEAHNAGIALKREGFSFDVAYTSFLKRANETLNIALGEMGATVPIEYSWRLNERHYGALQGLRHSEMAEKFSPEQVLIWRRSYDVKPPALEPNDPRNPAKDPKYKDLKAEEIPLGESLEDTVNRVLPYWNETIAPAIKSGKKVIVAASGNSLRALIKHLDGISNEDIVKLEIETGVPLIYELGDDLKPVKHYYLR